MFFGHTHGDSWQILYDPEDYVRPVAAAFISPSATTGSHRNPSFRVYTVDGGYSGATWTVMDAQTYNMNMTTANLEGGVPEYTLRYEAQDSYDLRSLTPASLDLLVTRLASDDALFRTFLRNVNNYWDEPAEMWTCDQECRKGQLCGLVRGDSSNDEPCQRIQDIVDGASK
nr:sphingomyelin phosphodiesterase-like [Penaeus vannamei]